MPRSWPSTEPSPLRSGPPPVVGASQPEATSAANDCARVALSGHDTHVFGRPKVLEEPESSNHELPSVARAGSTRRRHTSSAFTVPPLYDSKPAPMRPITRSPDALRARIDQRSFEVVNWPER
jgi:hypothetical protein